MLNLDPTYHRRSCKSTFLKDSGDSNRQPEYKSCSKVVVLVGTFKINVLLRLISNV